MGVYPLPSRLTASSQRGRRHSSALQNQVSRRILFKFPARYVKKWNFGIQNGRQAAILDRINSIFCGHMGPLVIHPHTKFGLPNLSRYRNFPQKRFRLRRTTDVGRRTSDVGRTTTDDGRKVNAIARWSFGPSGLKILSEWTGPYLMLSFSGDLVPI